MSVNVILSGHGMNSEPYLANLAATEEGIAYIYNAKRDLDEAEGEFYLTSESLDMTSLDENGELSDFITALRVWDQVAKENVAKKIDFQSLGNFPKGSINQILAYSEVDEEGNPTGFKAMAALGGVNLLHNWYFANPVNQRGQTSYTGSGYTIDRWRANAQVRASLEENGISLASSQNASMAYLVQRMEHDLTEKYVTVSVLLSDNTLLFGTGKMVAEDGWHAQAEKNYAGGKFVVYASYHPTSAKYDFGIASYTTTPVTVIAAKLELGETQTLAHQDENGNWVLNEIPNHGEELIRCQSAPVDIDGAGGVLPLTGGTVTGTLVLSKTNVPLIGSDNNPPLIVGGPKTGPHLELGKERIIAKTNTTKDCLMQFGEARIIEDCEIKAQLTYPRIRNIYMNTTSMTSSKTSLSTGRIYLQYEQ